MNIRLLAVLTILLALFTPTGAAAQDVPTVSPPVVGSLDLGDPIFVWALDKRNPTASIKAEIFVHDGTKLIQIWNKETDAVRTDVNTYFNTTGKHALGVLMPEDVKTRSAGGIVTVWGYAFVDGIYYELEHSPLRETFIPASAPGPRIQAKFRTSAGLMPSDDSTTTLYRWNDNFSFWEYVVGSDANSGNGNGRILNGTMKYWFRYNNNGLQVPFECGAYLAVATEANGQTAYREFPMCGGSVDLGTLTLSPYPAKVTISKSGIVGGKISYPTLIENTATVPAEVYTVVNSATPNATFTTYVTNREDLPQGNSNRPYEANIPKGVPRGINVSIQVIVTEKDNPHNVLGYGSFSVTTQKQ